MKTSLSVRIVEAACKTKLHMPLEDILAVAAEVGYDAICMRASGVGVHSTRAELQAARRAVDAAGLGVSMVTADFNVPLNNARGPESLREIRPSLDVAQELGCDLVRVCMKTADDIAPARLAAEHAAERGMRLAHQCHTDSLFEQVAAMLEVLRKIDRSNFGLIYEPANLLLCGEPYGEETLRQLRPHLMNAYVQNHRLDPAGPESLPTACLGDRRFHHLPLWDQGGVDFAAVFAALEAIGYDGHFTIHQAEKIEGLDDARRYAARCLQFIRDRGR